MSKLKKPLKSLKRHLDEDTLGLVICILADMFNEFTKDNDREMRTLAITINDFFSYKYDFEKERLEK